VIIVEPPPPEIVDLVDDEPTTTSCSAAAIDINSSDEDDDGGSCVEVNAKGDVLDQASGDGKMAMKPKNDVVSVDDDDDTDDAGDLCKPVSTNPPFTVTESTEHVSVNDRSKSPELLEGDAGSEDSMSDVEPDEQIISANRKAEEMPREGILSADEQSAGTHAEKEGFSEVFGSICSEIVNELVDRVVQSADELKVVSATESNQETDDMMEVPQTTTDVPVGEENSNPVSPDSPTSREFDASSSNCPEAAEVEPEKAEMMQDVDANVVSAADSGCPPPVGGDVASAESIPDEDSTDGQPPRCDVTEMTLTGEQSSPHPTSDAAAEEEEDYDSDATECLEMNDDEDFEVDLL